MKDVTLELLSGRSYCLRLKDRTAIGFATILFYENMEQCEFIGFYIDPNYRGKGYADFMFKKLLEISQQISPKLREIMVTTSITNKTNILLERKGFTKWNKWSLFLEKKNGL